MVEHSDGSAPLASSAGGELIGHHKGIYKLRKDASANAPAAEWDTPAYVLGRRDQIEVRIEEVIEAAGLAASLDSSDRPELAATGGVSFKNRLDVRDGGVHLCGHSYGGATVLGAAGRRPELFRSVAAHDPAVDWLSDDVRYNCFKGMKEEETDYFEKGSGGYRDERKLVESKGLDSVPVCMIYCSQWQDWKFGHFWKTLPKISEGSLGKKGQSVGMVVRDCKHFEFSDNCLIQPAWLNRALDFCGTDPAMRSAEIKTETRNFMRRFD